MFHAVVEVARDPAGRRVTGAPAKPESMIEVLLDPMADDQARALLQRLHATLGDVRLAVDDYAAMLAMTDRAIGELDARARDLQAELLDEYRAFLALDARPALHLSSAPASMTTRARATAATPRRSRPTSPTGALACCATSAATFCAARASPPS